MFFIVVAHVVSFGSWDKSSYVEELTLEID